MIREAEVVDKRNNLRGKVTLVLFDSITPWITVTYEDGGTSSMSFPMFLETFRKP